jgi:hypothetical protein
MFGAALTGATQVGTTVKFEAVAGQGKRNHFIGIYRFNSSI